jgi:hypothetical protein
MTIRSYTELCKFQTYTERYAYLKLTSEIGKLTFGFDRRLNQDFYRSIMWRQVRDIVLTRDNGCDLGVPGREIHTRPIIHHMNPVMLIDLVDFNPSILDPEFLITTSIFTHGTLHFGDKKSIVDELIERKKGDTKLW